MTPICITEGEDVVIHHQAKGLHGGSDGNIGIFLLSQILCNENESFLGGDVSVHRHGISNEQEGIRWKVQGKELLFQNIGALEVGSLLFGNFLQFAVHPAADAF